MLRKNYAVLHQEKLCKAKIQNQFCFSVLIILFTLFSSCSKDDPKSEEIKVTVETKDMTFTIDENPTENQSIGIVPGTTNQGSVTFSIIEQTPAGAFSIDAKTGQLYVDNVSIYDYESVTSISGKIKVANGDIFDISEVLVVINDAAEDVYDGDVVLSSQEEVEAFGLNNYREITGSLRIVDNEENGSPIKDLSSLGSLEKINEEIAIIEANMLSTLIGLDNIESAEECHIFNNSNLEDIDALKNISSLNFLRISFNPKLSSLGDFSKIENLENGFRFVENNSATSLPKLNNLVSVGSLTIHQNEQLSNVADLSALNTITGELHIENNPNLVDLIGLNNLEMIEGTLTIIRNMHLFDINSIQNVTSIQDKIYINLNDNLQNVDGLLGLTGAKSLQIIGNGSLQHVDGLANLQSLEEGLQIIDNESLNDFCGLTTLMNNSFSGSYSVYDNLFNPTVEDILNDNCSNQ